MNRGIEISIHELRIYAVLKQSQKWMTSREIATKAKVAERTARQHAQRLAELRILDVAELFPAYKYRFSQDAMQRNSAYIARLEAAASVVA